MQNVALTAVSNTLRGFRGEVSRSKVLKRSPKCACATLSTILAVYVAHWIGLGEIWWAAICAFSLTDLDLKPAANQGAQQIAGTICGVALGWALSQYVASQIGLFVFSITCLSAAGLYLAMSRAAGYMWILSTALAIFMIATVHAHTETHPLAVAEALFINAVVGTVAYWTIIALSHGVLLASGRPKGVAEAVPAAPSVTSSDRTFSRLRHTVVGAATLSILAYLAYRYPLEGFAQAMTTALVTLLVPLDVRGGWSLYAVVLRMCHRLLGCLFGSFIVLSAMPFTAGHMLYCMIALCISVWLACHFRFGDQNVSYFGTQMGAVVILAFVHDRVWLNDDVAVAYSRLIGVASGTAALAVVLALVSSVFSSSRSSRRV
jgi:uncharacterized membrane protein YccC